MVAPIAWSDQFAAHGAVLLRHTCTIRRQGAIAGYDDYQEPVCGDPAETTGVRCFYWQPPSGGEVSEPGREFVGHAPRLLVAGTAVLAEHDQIADVRDEKGRVIQAGPLQIQEVIRRLGRLLVICQQAATGDTAP